MKNWMDDCMNDYLAQKTYQKAVNPYKSIVEARKLCHCVHKELARLKSHNLKKIITMCEKTHMPKKKSRKIKSRKIAEYFFKLIIF